MFAEDDLNKVTNVHGRRILRAWSTCCAAIDNEAKQKHGRDGEIRPLFAKMFHMKLKQLSMLMWDGLNEIFHDLEKQSEEELLATHKRLDDEMTEMLCIADEYKLKNWYTNKLDKTFGLVRCAYGIDDLNKWIEKYGKGK